MRREETFQQQFSGLYEAEQFSNLKFYIPKTRKHDDNFKGWFYPGRVDSLRKKLFLAYFIMLYIPIKFHENQSFQDATLPRLLQKQHYRGPALFQSSLVFMS